MMLIMSYIIVRVAVSEFRSFIQRWGHCRLRYNSRGVNGNNHIHAKDGLIVINHNGNAGFPVSANEVSSFYMNK